MFGLENGGKTSVFMSRFDETMTTLISHFLCSALKILLITFSDENKQNNIFKIKNRKMGSFVRIGIFTTLFPTTCFLCTWRIWRMAYQQGNKT